MQRSVACQTVEELEVECTHCGVLMTSSSGGGGTIRYFHCPSCSRWSSSMYSEVLRADTKMRSRRPGEERHAPSGTVKERLENWLRAIAESDPYKELGVTTGISDAALRERYLQLAREHHPDRGGSAEAMRKVNDAYEKVLADRECRRLRAAHGAGAGLSLKAAS